METFSCKKAAYQLLPMRSGPELEQSSETIVHNIWEPNSPSTVPTISISTILCLPLHTADEGQQQSFFSLQVFVPTVLLKKTRQLNIKKIDAIWNPVNIISKWKWMVISVYDTNWMKEDYTITVQSFLPCCTKPFN